ncbi:protein of unknown function (plasmid) [Cupriavidus taiwanensis]|uniref:Uncharacterized protein n=1 Tax=Cupriavidus taiwanensis TaxID=164546 RepID=A0A375HA52_9BURK|nr:protein of unknown function [Cupriavidus taiwanensis]SOZ72121.1 protein of unknown function [Cupriavidus taiwanensis]SOZ74415.1 protein of unknown function [Cupriavidus taiwanensis]SPA03321.1 protein of unknown function [Cupriavidus taiwanensis]SPA11296.1 protein of unknown function [Cupriavidus taiwanensis]
MAASLRIGQRYTPTVMGDLFPFPD